MLIIFLEIFAFYIFDFYNFLKTNIRLLCIEGPL